MCTNGSGSTAEVLQHSAVSTGSIARQCIQFPAYLRASIRKPMRCKHTLRGQFISTIRTITANGLHRLRILLWYLLVAFCITVCMRVIGANCECMISVQCIQSAYIGECFRVWGGTLFKKPSNCNHYKYCSHNTQQLYTHSKCQVYGLGESVL